MTSTCRDIASRALVKLGVTPLGSTPDAVSLGHAIAQLQSSLLELLGGALGRLYDVAVTADCTAFPGLRLRCDAPGITVTNPLNIPYFYGGWSPVYDQDMPWLWWGVDPNTTDVTPPANLACAVVIDYDKTEHVWVYNAYAGVWADLNAIDANTPFPLPNTLENAFAAMIAFDMLDVFPEQSQLTVSTLQAQAGRGKAMLATKFDNPREVSCGDYY